MENFPPDKAGFFKRIKPFALSGTELINSVFPTRRSPQTKQGGKKKFHGELGPTSNNLKKVFFGPETRSFGAFLCLVASGCSGRSWMNILFAREGQRLGSSLGDRDLLD